MKKPAAIDRGLSARAGVRSAAAGAFALGIRFAFGLVATAGAFALTVGFVIPAVSLAGVVVGSAGAFACVGGRSGCVGDLGRGLLFVAARKEQGSGTEDSESGRDVFELHGGGIMHAPRGIVYRDRP